MNLTVRQSIKGYWKLPLNKQYTLKYQANRNSGTAYIGVVLDIQGIHEQRLELHVYSQENYDK